MLQQVSLQLDFCLVEFNLLDDIISEKTVINKSGRETTLDERDEDYRLRCLLEADKYKLQHVIMDETQQEKCDIGDHVEVSSKVDIKNRRNSKVQVECRCQNQN